MKLKTVKKVVAGMMMAAICVGVFCGKNISVSAAPAEETGAVRNDNVNKIVSVITYENDLDLKEVTNDENYKKVEQIKFDNAFYRHFNDCLLCDILLCRGVCCHLA